LDSRNTADTAVAHETYRRDYLQTRPEGERFYSEETSK
jgi:hypothetical protein